MWTNTWKWMTNTPTRRIYRYLETGEDRWVRPSQLTLDAIPVPLLGLSTLFVLALQSPIFSHPVICLFPSSLPDSSVLPVTSSQSTGWHLSFLILSGPQSRPAAVPHTFLSRTFQRTPPTAPGLCQKDLLPFSSFLSHLALPRQTQCWRSPTFPPRTGSSPFTSTAPVGSLFPSHM